MKKYLFIIPLLALILIPHSVFAKTFEVNGEQLTVTKDNYIYYFYSKYPEFFDKYNYFLGFTESDTGFSVVFSNSTEVDCSSNMIGFQYDTAGTFQRVYLNIYNGYEESKEYTKNGIYLKFSSLAYSNFDINKSDYYSFSANISKQDLIDFTNKKPIYNITYYLNNEIYKTFEVEKGTSYTLLTYDYNSSLYNFSGWNVVTENVDLNNITSDVEIRATLEAKAVNPIYITNFPITKEEFYTLMTLVAALIMMLLLRWTFPWKGGSDLK